MAFEAELEAASEAAAKAADLIRARIGDLHDSQISLKGKNDLVTEVDLESQQLIVDLLRQGFPDYHVLAEEEMAGTDAEHDVTQWIIDPVDGTTNFVHAMPPFSVSIGLMYERRLVVGVILEIGHDELFTARQGAGAAMNGKEIRTSRTTSAVQSMLATGFPTRDLTLPHLDTYMSVLRKSMMEYQSVRRLGSAAADLAYVACGRLDGFFEIGLSPWDSAAGAVIIREAGGRVTDFEDDDDFLFGPQVLASNGPIHEAMLELVEPLVGVREQRG